MINLHQDRVLAGIFVLATVSTFIAFWTMIAAWAEGGYRLDLRERQVYDLEGRACSARVHRLNSRV